MAKAEFGGVAGEAVFTKSPGITSSGRDGGVSADLIATTPPGGVPSRPKPPAQAIADLSQSGISGVTGRLVHAVPREIRHVASSVSHLTKEADHAINLATAPVRRAINPVLMPGYERHFDSQFDRPYKERLGGEGVIVRHTTPLETSIPQTVVFAHGFQQIGRDARAVQQALHQRGIASVSFEPGPHSIDRYAAITAELMEHVADVSGHDTVTLLPISMGGVYGSRAVRLNPERVGGILYVEPGGFDKQSPVGLSVKTLVGGLKEAAAVIGDRHYRDAGVMLGGLTMAARNILTHPIPALQQINAIAVQHVSAIDEATYMKVIYGTPTALILMADDETFEQGTMLEAVARADEAVRSDDRTPVTAVFDIVRIAPGTHFTLSSRPETIEPIVDTVIDLYTLQQQNIKGSK